MCQFVFVYFPFVCVLLRDKKSCVLQKIKRVYRENQMLMKFAANPVFRYVIMSFEMSVDCDRLSLIIQISPGLGS